MPEANSTVQHTKAYFLSTVKHLKLRSSIIKTTVIVFSKHKTVVQ